MMTQQGRRDAIVYMFTSPEALAAVLRLHASDACSLWAPGPWPEDVLTRAERAMGTAGSTEEETPGGKNSKMEG